MLNRTALKFGMLVAISWTLLGVVRMAVAEATYSLDTSSLWSPRYYQDRSVEIHRLQQAVGIQPREAQYYYRFAQLHSHGLGQRWDDKGFRSAPTLTDPDVPSERSQKLIALALGSFQGAIRLNPTHWEYHLGLAWFYHYLAGSKLLPTAQGLAALEMDRALALSSTHLLVRDHVAMFYLDVDKAKASSIIAQTIVLAPKETDKYLDRLRKAFGDFSFIPMIAPRNTVGDLISFQGNVSRIPGQDEKKQANQALIPVLEEASRQFPSTYDLLFALGHAHKHGEDPRCLQWYARAYHAASSITHKIAALEAMVAFHVNRQELAEALALTEEKLRTLNNPPQLLYVHSTILAKMGRSEEAIRAMEKATAHPDILSQSQRRTFQGRLGGLYRESRQFIKAIKVWKRMLYGPDYPLLSTEERDSLSGKIKEAELRLKEAPS